MKFNILLLNKENQCLKMEIDNVYIIYTSMNTFELQLMLDSLIKSPEHRYGFLKMEYDKSGKSAGRILLLCSNQLYNYLKSLGFTRYNLKIDFRIVPFKIMNKYEIPINKFNDWTIQIKFNPTSSNDTLSTSEYNKYYYCYHTFLSLIHIFMNTCIFFNIIHHKSWNLSVEHNNVNIHFNNTDYSSIHVIKTFLDRLLLLEENSGFNYFLKCNLKHNLEFTTHK